MTAPRFTPRRALGRTGFLATALGVGDLADRARGLDACVATLRRALDAGLNVVDTAPSYEDGFSEEVVCAALRGRREGVFVIDKIDHLDRPLEPQVRESVARLGFVPDAFVLHGVSDLDAWSRAASPGGLFDQLASVAPFRGVSTHHPAVARAAIERSGCDVAMFAIGPHADPRYEREILPLARARGVGTVCFKTFGAGKLVGDTEGYGRPLADPSAAPLPRLSVEECVHYTLTIDPDVALLGLSTEDEQDEAFAAAERHAPLSPDALDAIRARAAEAVRGKGRIWWDPQ